MNNNTHMNDERHTTASELYAKLQSNKNSTTFAELNDWYGVGNYVLKCVPLGETAYWTGLPKTVCAALIELSIKSHTGSRPYYTQLSLQRRITTRATERSTENTGTTYDPPARHSKRMRNGSRKSHRRRGKEGYDR